ncbi:phage portal protein [Paenibacillus abyssi]|uniref:Phage portal protein n=1 Tax=Paenibacillus abyssi TaxID=1340531 RepID=A0A917CJG9_9BACL|nr:phage portal protein [Paenibacillus abyssi]GGF88401.1 hypothetical protein GCM10010916_02160 [Paenibacillus abyssi]
MFRTDHINSLIFSVDQAQMGSRETERIQREIRLYKRYDGTYNVWTEYTKPADIDYEPATLTIGYPRKLIDTLAAWQFEKEPKVTVPPDVIDDPAAMLAPGYTVSTEQAAENTRAKAKERLLTWVWDDNRMHEKLLAAAKDRLITESGVYARLHYDKRRGDIRVFFHPSIEVIAIHDPWDIDRLTEVHFIAYLDEDMTQLWKLSYYLVWRGDEDTGTYDCEIEEGVYGVYESDDKAGSYVRLDEERVARSSMGLDFIPVVHVPADGLTGQIRGYSELERMITISDEIDRKLSDYSDALRFEMFAITLLMNVEEDPKAPLKVAPSAKWNLGSAAAEEGQPDAKRMESGFKFKEAIESYLDRMYAALHEISEVPIVNTAEMKTGGVNDMAIQLLFSSIISKTQRSWITWQSRLQTLNEYVLRYMQARAEHPRFKYDKALVAQMDGEYYSEIIFGLPLPQDQAALISQLSEEIAMNIESIRGAITRSGKENAEAKFLEILAERNMLRAQQDPYSGGGDVDEDEENEEITEDDERGTE